MKARSILIIILMTVIPILVSAQTQSGNDSAPTNPPAAADSLLPDPGQTSVPAGPESLGPQDVLQEYQTVMVAITQNFTANLAGITEAVQEKKMSSEEGKTSTAEQYLIAKMQFQLLSAWREMDKQDQAKAPAPDDSAFSTLAPEIARSDKRPRALSRDILNTVAELLKDSPSEHQ